MPLCARLFHSLLSSLFTTWENSFVQRRLGAVHRDTLTISRDNIRRILTSPGGRDWWERGSVGDLTPEFRQAIEESAGELDRPVSLRGSPTTVGDIWIRAVVHLHEHLGQSIAYARSNGVVPPWSR